MIVDVEDFLSVSIIHHQSIVVGNPEGFGDLFGCAVQQGQHFRRRFVERSVLGFWHNQQVDAIFRPMIGKYDYVVVFHENPGGNFTVDDFSEDIRHVGNIYSGIKSANLRESNWLLRAHLPTKALLITLTLVRAVIHT